MKASTAVAENRRSGACDYSLRFTNERCRTEVPKLQFYPGTTHLHACHAVEEGRLPDLPDTPSAPSARPP